MAGRNLRRGGFIGELMLVYPDYDTIDGMSVYPNVGPIPGRTTTLAGPLQLGGFSMQVSRSHWGGFNVSGQVNHFQGGVAARKEKP